MFPNDTILHMKGSLIVNITRKFIAIACSFFIAIPVFAQSIKEVVAPFPPGGSNDLFARYIVTALNKQGVQAIAVNKPGAEGMIGLDYVRRHQDNRTLVVASAAVALYGPLVVKTIDMDILKDFQPVTMLARDPMYIIVPAASKYKNLKELISDLQNNPGKLNFSSAAASTFYACRVFMEKIKGNAVHIPYKGGPAAVTAVASGQVDFGCPGGVDVAPFIGGDRVRILGIATSQRVSALPEIPTLVEQGVQLTHESWAMLLAHKNMDDEYLSKINKIVTETIINDTTSSLINGRMSKWTTSPKDASMFLQQQIDMTKMLVTKYPYQ